MTSSIDLSTIDIYDPEQYRNAPPYDKFAALRAQAPVYRHDDPDVPEGHWALTRHADVVFVSRNPEIFSSYEKTALAQEFPMESIEQNRLLMLNQDAPQHARTRAIVNRGFTPRLIGRLEERIQSVCEEIVAAAVAKGEGDFVTLCAAELPLIMIAELMGVPHEDRHKVFNWSNRMIGFDDPEFQTSPEDAQLAAMEMFVFANALAEEKRQKLSDDIISKLVSADEEGNILNELEFDMFFILLAVAGNETTRNAISGGMHALIEFPEQWNILRSNPEKYVPTCADEVVRWSTPVNQFRRTAMSDVEVGGQLIKKGEKVLIYYSAANRDETVFANPETFDITRDPNPHIGFGGGGPHFCLGRHLAKLELECMFRALANQVERVEFTAPARRLRSNFINGIKEMPVRFIPAS